MARLTKAAIAASPNVVRLPTAAPRQVINWRFAEQRRASIASRKDSPFRHRYIDPHVRAKLPDAAALLEVERTPELLLALAIFQALAPEQQAQVRADCEIMKHTGIAARGAATMVQVRTYGDSASLDAAISLLREGRNG
jgi:hypothetical protein